ncbi:MAG TPA: SDR family oxidoreductase, partial [Spirochaetia bacterium]|nr:SDR family oxidoreductase [Spirochaetia bacterium]
GSLEGISIASLEEALKINALSPLSLITAFVRQRREGSVVNILDARMTDYDRMHPGYEASKHLLFSFTRMAALEWAPLIRVNAVAPGFIRFDESHPEGVPSSGRDSEALSAAAAPLKRTTSAAEVAEASIFLLRSVSITGQVLFVDGGRHLKGRVFSI